MWDDNEYDETVTRLLGRVTQLEQALSLALYALGAQRNISMEAIDTLSEVGGGDDDNVGC